MSLRIIKAGILDTIQDGGRYGFQHLGINPNGAMDRHAAQTANALLGKDLRSPVLEMHFPSPRICFEKETMIAIAGADFSPSVNGKNIPVCHPVIINKGAILEFERIRSGSNAYMAILHDLDIPKWMNSYSTNLKAGAGGWQGRALASKDILPFKKHSYISLLPENKDFKVLPWKACEYLENPETIEFIIGSEWNWLSEESKVFLENQKFQVSPQSDRMGYRINGIKLNMKSDQQLVSAAVNFGTVQLLPNGQLIVLMADHQTTGGYPRVAHITPVHLSILAQKKSNDIICFSMISLKDSEKKWAEHQKNMLVLLEACRFKLENLFHAYM